MKYQSIAVIFVLILLPIALVLSNYIQNQTDTLALETSYKTKLADSTYDAIAAYQINSLNTQSVAGESIKSYVTASVNTFFTTLATNMGISSASKTSLLPYVPAILFTTYDGYYIYSPTKTNTLATIPGGVEGEINAEDAGQAIKTQEGNLIFLKSGYESVVRDGQAQANSVPYSSVYDVGTGKEKKNDAINAIDNSGGGVTINPKDNDVDYNYMVKPFIYYSANYKGIGSNKFNFVASYTLDNYVTLYGEKETGRDTESGSANPYISKEFTKSGYLIDPSKITLGGTLFLEARTKKNDTQNGNNANDPYSENNIAPSANSGETYYEAVINQNKNTGTNQNNVRYALIDIASEDAYKYINYFEFNKNGKFDYNGKQYFPNIVSKKDTTDANKREPVRIQTGNEIIEDSLNINQLKDSGKINDTDINSFLTTSGYTQITVKYNGIQIDDYEAKEYYIKAYFFSKWVERNLGDIELSSTQIEQSIPDIDTNGFAYETSHEGKIFKIDSSTDSNIKKVNDPETEDSLIAKHKRDIIKNSIQYNLNSAIATYNRSHNGVVTEYQLPVLKEDDWNLILNNICMVSFMQGIPCGTQIFNDYVVVKSNNNNNTATIENLYFTPDIGDQPNQTSQYQYHKIDCGLLTKNDVQIYEADQSAEFKYDARKLNSKIDSIDGDEKIQCFYDDSTNTYYRAVVIDSSITDEANINRYAIGEVITDEGELAGYRELPTGTGLKYLYDHKNEGCYECIIGGNYEPKFEYYRGDLYIGYTTIYGEKILYYDPYNSTGRTAGKWIYTDGTDYTGNKYGNDSGKDASIKTENITELEKRRKSVYTYMAKIRNNLYKTNDHVNR